MTVHELIETLNLVVSVGGGDRIVCIESAYDGETNVFPADVPLMCRGTKVGNLYDISENEGEGLLVIK